MIVETRLVGTPGFGLADEQTGAQGDVERHAHADASCYLDTRRDVDQLYTTLKRTTSPSSVEGNLHL
jgi:hypothetical protein